jgi:hypothetical protein
MRWRCWGGGGGTKTESQGGAGRHPEEQRLQEIFHREEDRQGWRWWDLTQMCDGGHGWRTSTREWNRSVRWIFWRWMVQHIRGIFQFWSGSIPSHSKPNMHKVEWNRSPPPNSRTKHYLSDTHGITHSIRVKKSGWESSHCYRTSL